MHHKPLSLFYTDIIGYCQFVNSSNLVNSHAVNWTLENRKKRHWICLFLGQDLCKTHLGNNLVVHWFSLELRWTPLQSHCSHALFPLRFTNRAAQATNQWVESYQGFSFFFFVITFCTISHITTPNFSGKDENVFR